MAGLLALVGPLLAACSGVPDRSAVASALSAELRALPGVDSVDGRYSHEPVMGYSYNVDVQLAAAATREQAVTLAERYYAGLVKGDFARHTSRVALHFGDDAIRVFSDTQHRDSPSAAVDRWYRLTRDVPGALDWASHIDSARGRGSITLKLDRPEMNGSPAQLAGLAELLAARASDLADRQWIIHWRKLRLDLMGPEYPAAATVALITRLAENGQWTAVHDPGANPTLRLAVWAASPEQMESIARDHLPQIAQLGFPVRYTVRANRTEAVEVLVGGCLTDGSELQQRLNREFGHC